MPAHFVNSAAGLTEPRQTVVSEMSTIDGLPMGRKPRVLIYTTLFPNSAQPLNGNFILERMRHLIPYLDMTVVAPVPYFPRTKIHKGWFTFSTIPHSERFREFEIDHPRYLVIPKLAMSTHGLSMFAGSLSQVSRLLRAADYDLIDAHYVYPDGFAATMLGARFNKPVVISARGSDINLFSRFRTIRPMLRHALNRATKVIAVTQSLKDVMIDLGCEAEKIAVIGNGIDTVKFNRQPRSVARRKLGLPADRAILLAVGNLTENKGVRILIDAILRLRVRRPDVLLVIAGAGPHRARLQRQIQDHKLEDNVRLAGSIPHAELAAWYSAADVFCLASLREGCPNVVMEAMACGCPVVATRAGGIPDMVSSPSLGILVDRTAEAFQASLDEALHREWDHAAIVAHAHSRGWEKVTSELLTLYSEVLTVR